MKAAKHALTDMLMAGWAIQEAMEGLSRQDFEASARLQKTVLNELANLRASAYRLQKAYREVQSDIPFARLDAFDAESWSAPPSSGEMWSFVTGELPRVIAHLDELLHEDPWGA